MSIFITQGATINILTKEYNGVIEHLSFNTLISFPDKALDTKNKYSKLYDETKITPLEFNKILQELYSNNYILISIKELYFSNNNIIYPKPLFLPQNKKPIILSFNNVSYKSSYQNSGEIDKIIIDNNNQFATYSTKQNIQNRISYNNEFIPILESFIKNNPDFSYNNARGIIFFTINNGVMGYKIDSKNVSSKHDIKRVSELIRQLKNRGWEFGSNNYNSSTDTTLNDVEFINNISLWKKHTITFIEDTPYYASLTGQNITTDSTKLNILLDNKFNIFFYDNNNPSLHFDNNIITMSRKPVNGNSLRDTPEIFNDIFDCKKIYDTQARTIPYPHT
jgi:hypothetical protein